LAAAAKLAPESVNAFNIEGLASTPDGKLLIGFRNPIPGGKGIIVSLDNPKNVILGEKPELGNVFELTLKGRGIRSIEYSQQRGSYLIVAGPYNSIGAFALYSWSGKPLEDAIPISQTFFSGFRPEAMFFYPSETAAVQFLSDDGDDQVAGGDCKNAPVAMRRFRSLSLDIP